MNQSNQTVSNPRSIIAASPQEAVENHNECKSTVVVVVVVS
jgi:hypothetical protein